MLQVLDLNGLGKLALHGSQDLQIGRGLVLRRDDGLPDLLRGHAGVVPGVLPQLLKGEQRPQLAHGLLVDFQDSGPLVRPALLLVLLELRVDGGDGLVDKAHQLLHLGLEVGVRGHALALDLLTLVLQGLPQLVQLGAVLLGTLDAVLCYHQAGVQRQALRKLAFQLLKVEVYRLGQSLQAVAHHKFHAHVVLLFR